MHGDDPEVNYMVTQLLTESLMDDEVDKYNVKKTLRGQVPNYPAIDCVLNQLGTLDFNQFNIDTLTPPWLRESGFRVCPRQSHSLPGYLTMERLVNSNQRMILTDNEHDTAKWYINVWNRCIDEGINPTSLALLDDLGPQNIKFAELVKKHNICIKV